MRLGKLVTSARILFVHHSQTPYFIYTHIINTSAHYINEVHTAYG